MAWKGIHTESLPRTGGFGDSDMSKVVVVYDSRTGNTEKMAKAVADGAKSVKGVSVALLKVDKATRSDLLGAQGIIVGSPTHYHTITSRLSTFLDKAVGSPLKGKTGGAFGSYLWEGEAVEDLNRAMIGSGMELVSQGVRAKGAPSEEDLSRCYLLGRGVAERLAKK